VIHRNRRDHRHRRFGDDVGRVKPATETDFQQQHIRLGFRKSEERRNCRNLELGDVVAVVDGTHAHQDVDQFLFVDRPRSAVVARQGNTLVKAHEMRRGVDMHAPARRFDHRFQIGSD